MQEHVVFTRGSPLSLTAESLEGRVGGLCDGVGRVGGLGGSVGTFGRGVVVVVVVEVVGRVGRGGRLVGAPFPCSLRHTNLSPAPH